MKQIILLLIIMQCFVLKGEAQQIIKGKVIDYQDQMPLPGATIKVVNSKQTAIASDKGDFSITLNKGRYTLKIQYLGYQSKELTIQMPFNGSLIVTLDRVEGTLNEVAISTGYQQISKERITGAVVQVDQDLLNRTVSTNILDRIKDVVPGLIFNNNLDAGDKNTISIRGRSTLFANAQPLIVLDNFPYEGDLSNINPNDVESITVLKDAAAASIWGARASNGVIVITTKRGKFNEEPLISLSSNITIGKRPDLFYMPQMSIADFIDIEKKLFTTGFYTAKESSLTHGSLTPVVELLIAKRDGKIAENVADQMIEDLKNQDVRNDFDQYLQRNSINQQHALNIGGGGEQQKYFVSLGYDNNQQNLIGNAYSRLSLNAEHTYLFLNKKLELINSVYYTSAITDINNAGINAVTSGSISLYPYAKLADINGVPLPINRLRPSFLNTSTQQGLLDWTYYPLNELNATSNKSNSNTYRINSGLKYHILPGLNAQLLYQYTRNTINREYLRTQDSYFTRDLINRFTAVSPSGSLTRNIPLGGILDNGYELSGTYNLRAQTDFRKDWNKHNIDLLAGYEISDAKTIRNTYRLYGYDSDHAVSNLVNYTSAFSSYVDPTSSIKIPSNESQYGATDRFVSAYTNMAYTYNNKYIVSVSARIDKSNIFGVNTNQKGVPLYSSGIAWLINKESFYDWKWLSELKLRASYGVNGNVDKSLSAYTTALYNSGSTTATKQAYARILNPPNPELRWEKVKSLNFGLDFSFNGNIINGSFDYYNKWGIDIIGNTAFPTSTGISSFRGNVSNTRGNGVELNINSNNLKGILNWETNFQFSYATDKVTKYLVPLLYPGEIIVQGEYGTTPVEGKPLYSMYSYKWMGLDPASGDPLGYFNGQTSKEYSKIINNPTDESMIYHGPSRPPVFGSFRNTLTYKGFAMSFNITYKFLYYFRRQSVSYGNSNYGLMAGQGGHGDYDLRWQNPGDELKSSIPSMPNVSNDDRDSFYRLSSVLVEKGDHIRLQDINCSYSFGKKRFSKLHINNLSIFTYVNNIGILWKASKSKIDPDNTTVLVPRSIAFGLRTNF